jgi:hypothetical protein
LSLMVAPPRIWGMAQYNPMRAPGQAGKAARQLASFPVGSSKTRGLDLT